MGLIALLVIAGIVFYASKAGAKAADTTWDSGEDPGRLPELTPATTFQGGETASEPMRAGATDQPVGARTTTGRLFGTWQPVYPAEWPASATAGAGIKGGIKIELWRKNGSYHAQLVVGDKVIWPPRDLKPRNAPDALGAAMSAREDLA